MNIDKAIKILTVLEARSINNSTMFKKDALQLGIEALKEVKRVRSGDAWKDGELLPGETEE